MGGPGNEGPDRRAPPVSAGERKREGARAGWWAGANDWWAACGREGREGEREAVGWATRGGKKEKKEEKKVAGPKRKTRGNLNAIQMYLNLNLKFKFKSKAINKTMQRGMK
jgi:hypothetical protein